MSINSSKCTESHCCVALFDMDGVIFQGKNFWLDLHRMYKTEVQALALAKKYMETEYMLLSKITVEELWIGKSEAPLLQLVNERKYEHGIKELFDYLHAQGIRTGVVSSGPLQLAQRAQADLAIDKVLANEVCIENGRIAGYVNVNVPNNEKRRVGLELIASLGGMPQHSIFIGDEKSDASIAQEVGLSIAYNSIDETLNNVATHIVPRGNLHEIIPIVKAWIGTTIKNGPTAL